MLEQPEEKKFKKKGLKFKDNLTSIFALSTTTGEYAWASSPGVLPKNVQNSDSYEGSGDSEDATIGASTEGGDPSVGCTNEFKFFKFNNSEGISLSGMKIKKMMVQCQGITLIKYYEQFSLALEVLSMI
ncbi:hypothetical protein Lalb_Chr16g0387131 [Lupinus albus]|uniref:Uncharacterized protein n=1 Tax=Lupinus albus TaxID=3870 RepID=A0A6A4PDB8_LUPAL|nr:hypothetical protein Lalb_Chr16g0387131 [Lupinus albus]